MQNPYITLYIFFVCLSLAALAQASVTKGVSAINEATNSTASVYHLAAATPLPPHPVVCYYNPRTIPLTPKDCGYILNDIILRQDGVFEERLFNYQ